MDEKYEERQALYQLVAEMSLQRSAIGLLVVSTLPRRVVETYIEGLDIPLRHDAPKELVEIVHRAAGVFADELTELLRRLHGDKDGTVG